MLTARDVLGPGGRIAARLNSYEHRPEQLEMAEAVARCAWQGQHLWSRPAPASARASPISCRPSSRRRRDTDEKGQPPSSCVDAHDQPAGTTDPERHPLSAQRHAAGVHRRAGQGPRQLPEPAPAGHALGRDREPVQRTGGVRAACTDSRLGHSRRPTARWPTCTTARCRRSGTRWPATAAIAWAKMPAHTTTASTTRPAGACRTPRSWSSTMPCSSATWPCGARAQHPARLRHRGLRRGPHARGRRRRPPGLASPAARSSTCSASSTTIAPTRACSCITALREAQQQVVECRAASDDFFESCSRLASAANNRRQRPGPRAGIVANRSAPALADWPTRSSEHGRTESTRPEQPGFHRRRRAAVRRWPSEIDAGCDQQMAEAVYWIETSATRRAAAAHRLSAAADRCRPALARTPVRPGADASS